MLYINMYTKIWQNSYVILIITFVVLCIIFYLYGISFSTKLETQTTTNTKTNTPVTQTKIVKHFSWKYPLAISLIVWLVWHFYMYPPKEELEVMPPTEPIEYIPSGQKVVI